VPEGGGRGHLQEPALRPCGGGAAGVGCPRMELLLWRWSTSVQVTSLVMIAVFFLMLGRSIRTAALRWWVRAWLCNVAALAITLFFWFFQPPIWVMHAAVAPIYMGAKTAFILMLLQGAWAMRRPGRPLISTRTMVAGLA